jgi:outer membrane receptor protein involved in Fe transport
MANNHIAVKWQIRLLCIMVMLLSILTISGLAQTTGKISGTVTAAATGEPLAGVNLTIEKTTMGNLTDINGEYSIINIPPGTYRLRASMIGYEPMVIRDLVVSVNRTSIANFKLKEGMIEQKEILVTVDRIQQKKDQTSSVHNITSDQMKALPIENLDQAVGLQAGVVRDHFRGGRDKEVAYLVNGVRVQEAYDLNRAVTVENEAIQEVEVITGTFNAEYGNAMSGIVNAVTKDGGNTFKGSAAALGSNFFTPHSNIFPDLGVSRVSDLPRSVDYKVFLEGPIIENALTFLVNGRYQNSVGPRNAIRRFMPDDFSMWGSEDSTLWLSNHTGDNAIVPMQTNKTLNIFGKLSFKPWQMVRASLEYSYNDAKGSAGQYGRGSYGPDDYDYKYNPDGRATDYGRSQLFTATVNHSLSSTIFYELKASYLKNWNAYYVFEDPFETMKNSNGGDSLLILRVDSLNTIELPVYRYVHDLYADRPSPGPGFRTGGQNKSWNENWIEDYKAKFDGTWQVNTHHTLKMGVDFTMHNVHRFNTTIQNYYRGTPYENAYMMDSTGKITFIFYQPEIVLGRSTYSDIYVVKPWEYSTYLQDKMEFASMVINLGLRCDYFNPNATYPSEPRNPGNDLSYPDNPEMMSQFLKAPASYQFSPRFGLSYKLGEVALLRFSYGHFFQMPPLYALYVNREHVVGGDYETLMGNPLVKPQKTIQYEAGLWQDLGSNMSLEVAVFYRDIYDLLGTKIITTFNATHYGLYTNEDYGNARGLELKYDYSFGNVSAGINYTLQYTRGNSNSPRYNFDRAGDKIDEVNVLVPMDWDQRHTLNASISYNTESYGGSIIGRYDSGLPYSWAPLQESPQANVNLQPNNSTRPSLISVDLNAFIDVWSSGTTHARLSLLIYNLFDRLNEYNVNGTTGRAGDRIYRPTDFFAYRSNFSTIFERNTNPADFANPRSVKLGIEFIF